MKEQAFCYFGILKNRDQLNGLLNLLPKDQRPTVEKFMAEAAQWSQSELKTRLRQVMESEADEIWGLAEQRWAGQWNSVSPRIRQWLCEVARGAHGQEDY